MSADYARCNKCNNYRDCCTCGPVKLQADAIPSALDRLPGLVRGYRCICTAKTNPALMHDANCAAYNADHIKLLPCCGQLSDPGAENGGHHKNCGQRPARLGDDEPTLPKGALEKKRVFATGATRDTDAGKYDYEGFLSPLALEAYAAYMDVNRTMKDGSVRDSDNWQKGIPIDTYKKSWWRHFFDAWKQLRGFGSPKDEGELGALCGCLFNNFGLIHERMKADPAWLTRELAKYQALRKAELESRK